MALIPYRPFWDLDRWFDDEDWERWGFGRGRLPRALAEIASLPAMDVYETNGEVIAELEVPGVDPQKIDISVKDNVLRVEGGEEKKEEEKKEGYYRKEIRKGYFKRVAALPAEVIGEKAEATYQDGILKVIIPKVKPKKKEEKKGIKIKVKTK